MAENITPLIFACALEPDIKSIIIGRSEETPTPKTRFSIWTLLRTPGRFTTRPLPVYFTTKMSVVRPFSVLVRTKSAFIKTGRFLSKAEILGVGVFFPPFKIIPITFLVEVDVTFIHKHFCRSFKLRYLGSKSVQGGIIKLTYFPSYLFLYGCRLCCLLLCPHDFLLYQTE